MPSFLAYAKLNSDEALTEAALRLLKILPATESNTVFRNALKTWFRGGEARMEKLFSSAVMQTGGAFISIKIIARRPPPIASRVFLRTHKDGNHVP